MAKVNKYWMLFMFITFGCPIKTNFLKQICGQEVVLRPLFFFYSSQPFWIWRILNIREWPVLLVFTRQDTMHKTFCKTGTLSSQTYNESDWKLSFCRITNLISFWPWLFWSFLFSSPFFPTGFFFFFTYLAPSFPFLSENAYWN